MLVLFKIVVAVWPGDVCCSDSRHDTRLRAHRNYEHVSYKHCVRYHPNYSDKKKHLHYWHFKLNTTIIKLKDCWFASIALSLKELVCTYILLLIFPVIFLISKLFIEQFYSNAFLLLATFFLCWSVYDSAMASTF